MTDPPVPETAEPTPLSEPEPLAAESSTIRRHPIQLVTDGDLRRSRLTTFFRLALVIPHLVWQWLWGIVVFFVLVVAWLAGLFLGRVPAALHNFIAAYTRYSMRVTAYATLSANPFPSFTTALPYPADLEIASPLPQRRLGIFFRGLLAFPALVAMYPIMFLLYCLTVGAWFVALFTGRIGEGLRDGLVLCLRYLARVNGYLYLLTNRYPSFGP
jgi:Domain of unknown function (DUF4389)